MSLPFHDQGVQCCLGVVHGLVSDLGFLHSVPSWFAASTGIVRLSADMPPWLKSVPPGRTAPWSFTATLFFENLQPDFGQERGRFGQFPLDVLSGGSDRLVDNSLCAVEVDDLHKHAFVVFEPVANVNVSEA